MPIAVVNSVAPCPPNESSKCPKAVPRWREIAQTKCAQRDQAIPIDWRLNPDLVANDKLDVIQIPALCGLLSTKEVEMTELPAELLVRKLQTGELTSYEVTLAFCKRAAVAQQLTNCLSEIFFDDALDTAERLDTEFRMNGVPTGPLHGLPVSLKDCFHVEGIDATVGFTANAFKPTGKGKESEITKIMRACGAILFCKTNVPLAMMSGETYNNIYGYTTNPYNRNLSSGGSSGGESALLALKGSPLGIGTDVGGSVRIPAAWCGLYSLKPSFGRFPLYGCEAGLTGQEAVKNAVGPMATSLEAIKMWSKAVIDTKPWIGRDPDCLPIPWRSVEIPKKLCFGILIDDGIVKPLPPVTRALREMKEALEEAGHSVIDFSIQDPLYTESLKLAMYRSAAAKLLNETLYQTQEPWPPGYDLLKDLTGGIDGDEITANDSATQRILGAHIPATVSELWSAQSNRSAYAKRILQSWCATRATTGTGKEMDALISPCTAGTASTKYGFTYDNYTSLWNMLDYCATTLPVTTVSTSTDQKVSYVGRNNTETLIWDEYSMETSVGCPVSVQLIGRRLNEEYLIEMTRVCDEALKAQRAVHAS